MYVILIEITGLERLNNVRLAVLLRPNFRNYAARPTDYANTLLFFFVRHGLASGDFTRRFLAAKKRRRKHDKITGRDARSTTPYNERVSNKRGESFIRASVDANRPLLARTK
jgi:hypothetical protein